jgi:hypothetical protein
MPFGPTTSTKPDTPREPRGRPSDAGFQFFTRVFLNSWVAVESSSPGSGTDGRGFNNHALSDNGGIVESLVSGESVEVGGFTPCIPSKFEGSAAPFFVKLSRFRYPGGSRGFSLPATGSRFRKDRTLLTWNCHNVFHVAKNENAVAVGNNARFSRFTLASLTGRVVNAI